MAYVIRRADHCDLALLLKAQAASEHEVDPLSATEIMEGLLLGKLEAYVLETGHSVMVLGMQSAGVTAMLSCFWRTGDARGLMAETRAMLNHVRDVLREREVKHIYCCVSMRNPLHDRLVRFYRRFRLEPDMTRLGGSV